MVFRMERYRISLFSRLLNGTDGFISNCLLSENVIEQNGVPRQKRPLSTIVKILFSDFSTYFEKFYDKRRRHHFTIFPISWKKFFLKNKLKTKEIKFYKHLSIKMQSKNYLDLNCSVYSLKQQKKILTTIVLRCLYHHLPRRLYLSLMFLQLCSPLQSHSRGIYALGHKIHLGGDS